MIRKHVFYSTLTNDDIRLDTINAIRRVSVINPEYRNRINMFFKVGSYENLEYFCIISLREIQSYT